MTFFKKNSIKCSPIEEWNKILMEQNRKANNSTPDSSSGIFSEYHGKTASEVSDQTPERKFLKNQISKFSRLITTPSPPNPNFKRHNQSFVPQFSPEKLTFPFSHIQSNDDSSRLYLMPKNKKEENYLKKKIKTPAHTLDLEEESPEYLKKLEIKKNTFDFDILSDSVTTNIFSFLSSNNLCKSAMVCKRWYQLVWNPLLWSHILLDETSLPADKGLKSITRALSIDQARVCLIVQFIDLTGCINFTDKGMFTVARRCPELKELKVDRCVNLSNLSIFEVVSNCTNLELLSVAGCPNVTCVSLTPEANLQATMFGKQVYLTYLDMSDCCNLDDSCLQLVVTYCNHLCSLFLRRCFRVSDVGVQYAACYCHKLQELSLSELSSLSDLGLREVSRLGENLKYLSIAKCKKLTDFGLKHLVYKCTKLRYLNIRGCEGLTGGGFRILGNCQKLRCLDVGGLERVTDEELEIIAKSCKNLRRLSIKDCLRVTDEGIMKIAMTTTNLQQINLIGCRLSRKSLKILEKFCPECIIQHNRQLIN